MIFKDFKDLFLFYVYGYFAYMGVCVLHMCSVHGGENRALDPLELKFQALVITWVLGIKPGPREWQPVL